MYATVYHSLAKWFESRGSNPSAAVFAAGCGLTTATFMNFIATAGLVQFAHGPRLVDWLADHEGASLGAAAMIAMAHWWIGKTVGSRGFNRAAQGRSLMEPGKYFWAWYIVPTFGLWIVASAVAIVSTSSY